MAVVCYDLQRVMKNYGIEYGFEVMETIVSLAGDAEPEIYFTIRKTKQ